MEKRVGWEAGVRCGDPEGRLLYQSGWATRAAWPGGVQWRCHLWIDKCCEANIGVL